MITTRQLHYFVQIAECGSFSAAAERLFVAQSALSRQIQELEGQLDTRLFRRTARQPELTPAGQAFLPRARAMLNDLEKTGLMVREIGQGRRGTLRLGHSSTVPLSGGLLATLSDYLARFAGVNMEIAQQSSGVQVQELMEGRLDLGLLRLPLLHRRPGVQLLPLFSEPLLLAVAAGHPLAEQASVSLAELADEAFISIPHPQRGGLSHLTAELCTRAGFFPRSARVLSRQTTQLQLIQAGFGIALLPRSMALVAPGDVRLIALRDEGCISSVALIHREDDTELVMAFADHFRRAFTPQ